MKNENIQTPMSKYKTSITDFKNIVKRSEVGIKEVTLNKADSKSIPWPFSSNDKTRTKGVTSDFICILENTNGVSLALAFKYIGVPEEEQTVTATIKNASFNGEIVGGKPLNIEQFREKLKQFNKENKNKRDLNFLYILNQFSDIFMEEKLNIKDVFKEKEKSITNFLIKARDDLNLADLEKEQEKAEKAFKKTETIINKRVEELPEQSEIVKLEERIKRLRSIIVEKTIQIKKEEKFNEKQKKLNDATNDLITKQKELNTKFEDEIKNLPEPVKIKLRKNKI
jgi:hypothetical protein